MGTGSLKKAPHSGLNGPVEVHFRWLVSTVGLPLFESGFARVRLKGSGFLRWVHAPMFSEWHPLPGMAEKAGQIPLQAPFIHSNGGREWSKWEPVPVGVRPWRQSYERSDGHESSGKIGGIHYRRSCADPAQLGTECRTDGCQAP